MEYNTVPVQALETVELHSSQHVLLIVHKLQGIYHDLLLQCNVFVGYHGNCDQYVNIATVTMTIKLPSFLHLIEAIQIHQYCVGYHSNSIFVHLHTSSQPISH